jgi:hypothetical protein
MDNFQSNLNSNDKIKITNDYLNKFDLETLSEYLNINESIKNVALQFDIDNLSKNFYIYYLIFINI